MGNTFKIPMVVALFDTFVLSELELLRIKLNYKIKRLKQKQRILYYQKNKLKYNKRKT